MKKALILHRWLSAPEGDWYPWLKAELESRGYETWAPQLPTMDTRSPDLEIMLKYILDQKFVDQDTLVVSHSLGAVLAFRLAEHLSFKKGIVLAGWDFNDLTPEHQSFWPNMLDHSLIRKNVPEWVVLISDNDPYVTKYIAHGMADRLGAEAVEVGPKAHFRAKDGVTEVPEILKFV